jgi:hypothetical protein
VSLQVPSTAQLSRPKAYFYFYSPLQTVFSSPTVSDTTQVRLWGTGTGTPVTANAKTYNLSVPPIANKIRIIVYGYIDLGSSTVYININGTDVFTATFSNTSEAVIADYVGDIAQTSTPITVRIDVLRSGAENVSVYITKVFIATGIGVTSTTQTNILSFSVTYQLLRSGDIRYSPGIRVFIFGNRKTTAPLTLTIPATGVIVGRNNLGAGDDNDKAETLLAIITGSVTLQEGGEFTVSATLRGNVGASGDIVIITRILARAQLRRETIDIGVVRVYERGVVEYFARALLVLVPGGITSTAHAITRRDIQDRHLAWVPLAGPATDITLHNYRVAVVTPVHFTAAYDDDIFGEAFIEWLQVVVWG